MTSSSTDYVPEIFDTARRVVRTAIASGIPAFLAVAGAVPIILPVLHVYVGPKVWALLVAAAGFITAAAALITRIMANPRVNALLERFGLGGHSGPITASDTSYTTALDLTAIRASTAAAATDAATH